MSFVNLDFLNQNSLRAYPLRAENPKIDTSGVFVIPDGLIVDACFSISSDITKRVFISRLTWSDPLLTIEISDELNTLVCTFVVNRNTHTENQTYYAAPSAAYAGASAKLTIGSVDTLFTTPSGTFQFTLSNTEFEPTTVVPSVIGINRLVFNDQFGNTNSVTGDVLLEARQNLRFTYDSLNNKLILDAGDGLGLNQACNNPTPIRTINGVSPDNDGDFFFTSENCLTISEITNGLNFDDKCSQTCAGCDEVSTLTDRQVQMESDLLLLRDYYNSLLSALATYQANVNATCVV